MSVNSVVFIPNLKPGRVYRKRIQQDATRGDVDTAGNHMGITRQVQRSDIVRKRAETSAVQRSSTWGWRDIYASCGSCEGLKRLQ
jgi:hypothetical protein